MSSAVETNTANVGPAPGSLALITNGHQQTRRQRWARWNRRLVPYSFLLPFMLLFAVFTLYPFLNGLALSFTDYSPLAPSTHWVGIDNYRRLVADDRPFHHSLQNTLLYAALLVPAQTVVGLLLALYVNDRRWAHQLSRAAFFAPFVLSTSVVGIVWGWILDTRYGLLNLALEAIGAPSGIPWLTNVNWVMAGLTLVSLWWRAGFSMVLFLAGLQDIPRDLREAAQVDGANNRQVFLHITLPLLRPVTVLVATLALIEAVKAFGLMFFLTNGGPASASTTVVYSLYLKFQSLNMGYASAMGFLLLLVTVIVAFVRHLALTDQAT